MRLKLIPIKNKKDTISRRVEDAEVLINIKDNTATLIDEMPLDIWKSINGKRSVHDIVFRMFKIYKGTKREIANHSIEAIRDLKNINAIYYKKTKTFKRH